MEENKLINFKKYTTQITEDNKKQKEDEEAVWLKDRTPSRIKELFSNEEIEWNISS